MDQSSFIHILDCVVLRNAVCCILRVLYILDHVSCCVVMLLLLMAVLCVLYILDCAVSASHRLYGGICKRFYNSIEC